MKTSKKVSLKNKSNAQDPLDGDLSDFMLNAEWQVGRFELTKPKNKVVTLRMSLELLNEVKKQAKKSGLDYQRYIRLALENSVKKKAS